MRERRAARGARPTPRVDTVNRPPPFRTPSGLDDFDDLFAEPSPTEKVDPKTYKRPKKVHRPAPPEPTAPVVATLHVLALTDPEGTLSGRSLIYWTRPSTGVTRWTLSEKGKPWHEIVGNAARSDAKINPDK